MSDQPSLRCINCGTLLEAPADDVLGVTCPVCLFFNPLHAPAPEPDLTLDTLETELDHLLAHARTSGIPLDVIVRALRDELEFAAELASSNRNLCVQIIDLGPREGTPLHPSSRDDSPRLRGRTA
jgi:phage FluMu protein Com